MTARLIRFNKPYGVLSQFTAEGKWQGLKDYIDLPGHIHAGQIDVAFRPCHLPSAVNWLSTP